MVRHGRYLAYVLRHKLRVLVECWRLGLIWRGIVHDLDKFYPDEWFPYVERFYGEGRPSPKAKENFTLATLRHYHRNPHHWQYWVNIGRRGPEAMEMPDAARREMLADWRAMSTSPQALRAYLDLNRSTMLLHPNTLDWLFNQVPA